MPLPKIPKSALASFYELRSYLATIEHNETQDVNNPDRADKRYKNIERAKAICNTWINGNDPMGGYDQEKHFNSLNINLQ